VQADANSNKVKKMDDKLISLQDFSHVQCKLMIWPTRFPPTHKKAKTARKIHETKIDKRSADPFYAKTCGKNTIPFMLKESFLSLHSVFNVHMSRVETNIV